MPKSKQSKLLHQAIRKLNSHINFYYFEKQVSLNQNLSPMQEKMYLYAGHYYKLAELLQNTLLIITTCMLFAYIVGAEITDVNIALGFKMLILAIAIWLTYIFDIEFSFLKNIQISLIKSIDVYTLGNDIDPRGRKIDQSILTLPEIKQLGIHGNDLVKIYRTNNNMLKSLPKEWQWLKQKHYQFKPCIDTSVVFDEYNLFYQDHIIATICIDQDSDSIFGITLPMPKKNSSKKTMIVKNDYLAIIGVTICLFALFFLALIPNTWSVYLLFMLVLLGILACSSIFNSELLDYYNIVLINEIRHNEADNSLINYFKKAKYISRAN